MRILQLGKYWRKDGGIETHVKSLCKGLAENGVEVINLVSSIDGERSNFLVDNYKVVEVPTLGIFSSTSISPLMALAAKRLHEEEPFDLIHLHFPDPMSHLASSILPASIPRVITWHSDIVKQKNLLNLYRPFQRHIISNSAALVAPTEAHFSSSQQIPSNFPSDRRYIIPFGMNYERFRLTPEISKQIQNIRATLVKGKFVIFALGRHVEYKGFDILLDALSLTDAHLILGGEGPLTAKLKMQAQILGISDRVRFTGRLSDPEAVAFYHTCDVFCLPSVTQNEAFGLVQLEAMACGKPVICTKLNNGVNVVNPHMQTGLTVEVKNPKDLQLAIEQLRDNNELRTTLGMNALQHVDHSYSLKSMSNAHIQLYSKLINN